MVADIGDGKADHRGGLNRTTPERPALATFKDALETGAASEDDRSWPPISRYSLLLKSARKACMLDFTTQKQEREPCRMIKRP